MIATQLSAELEQRAGAFQAAAQFAADAGHLRAASRRGRRGPIGGLNPETFDQRRPFGIGPARWPGPPAAGSLAVSGDDTGRRQGSRLAVTTG
jgi:hypothetical protein